MWIWWNSSNAILGQVNVIVSLWWQVAYSSSVYMTNPADTSYFRWSFRDTQYIPLYEISFISTQLHINCHPSLYFCLYESFWFFVITNSLRYWVRERYGFISVGFCQRRTLLTLSVDHVRINTFCLYLLLPPWRGDVCCSIHHLFISNRSLLFIFWQYKPEQNLRWHDRRPAVVVLHLPPVERLGSGLYFK